MQIVRHKARFTSTLKRCKLPHMTARRKWVSRRRDFVKRCGSEEINARVVGVVFSKFHTKCYKSCNSSWKLLYIELQTRFPLVSSWLLRRARYRKPVSEWSAPQCPVINACEPSIFSDTGFEHLKLAKKRSFVSVFFIFLLFWYSKTT